MASFIKELFYGNIDPQACSFSRSSRYAKAMAIISENEDFLTDNLSGEEKRRFLAFTNAWDDVLAITSEEYFAAGFRIGAQFTHDAFVGESSQFKNYLKE